MQTKTLFKLACASVVLASASFTAQAHNETAPEQAAVKFVGDTQFSGFCQAVVENDLATLKNQTARNVGKVAASRRGVIRAVAGDQGVTCNGKSLIEFSEEKNAADVRAYLVAQL